MYTNNSQIPQWKMDKYYEWKIYKQEIDIT